MRKANISISMPSMLSAPLSCLGSLFGRMELLPTPGFKDRRQVRVRRRHRFVVRPAQVEEGILETDC